MDLRKEIAPGISGKVKFSRILQIAFIYKRFWRGISVALAEDSGSRSGRGQLGAGNGAGGGSKRANMSKKRQCRAPFFKISSILNFPHFPPQGVPKGSPRNPKGSSLKSHRKAPKRYIYVSCDVEFYRVLKLFKINLARTGALRFTLFWAGPRGRGARLGPARKVPKIPQTQRSCSIEIDFGRF